MKSSREIRLRLTWTFLKNREPKDQTTPSQVADEAIAPRVVYALNQSGIESVRLKKDAKQQPQKSR